MKRVKKGDILASSNPNSKPKHKHSDNHFFNIKTGEKKLENAEGSLKNYKMIKVDLSDNLSELDSTPNEHSKQTSFDEESHSKSNQDLFSSPHIHGRSLGFAKLDTNYKFGRKNHRILSDDSPAKTPLVNNIKFNIPNLDYRRMSNAVAVGDNFTFLRNQRRKKSSTNLILGKNKSVDSYFSSKNIIKQEKENDKVVVGEDGLPIVNEDQSSANSSEMR
jgi:hypothetical protein